MKRGLEYNFAWLFAIIVGTVIIFLAIYGVSNFVGTAQTQINTETAEQFGIILNPIETSFEDGKYVTVSFAEETRMINECISTGNFGRQLISTSVKNRLGDDYKEPLIKNFFPNKYLFSQNIEQGKKLHIISKDFKMPYKIASLIFATSSKYCFVNPPNKIKDEIFSFNSESIRVSEELKRCGDGSISVCFLGNNANCDILVDDKKMKVSKDGKELYYHGSLIYGAIFADSEVYECQVKRLMKRNSELTRIYADKSDFLSTQGCRSGLGEDLREYGGLSLLDKNEKSSKLIAISELSDQINRKNERLSCKLF